MARSVGPVWIVQPDFDEGAHPEHPIVIPPEEGAGDAHPEHPIVLPPDPPLGTWGGAGEPFPTPPIVIPPDLKPPDDAHPEHPIVLPPDSVWPGDEHPEHPIVLPPEAPDGIWGGGNEPFPTPPIVLPNPPDGGGSSEPVGAPTFYQRKTLGVNWDPNFDSCVVVSIKAGTSADDAVIVRTVANDGSSSVTYPQDFTGSVLIQVVGQDGYLEGSYTVK